MQTRRMIRVWYRPFLVAIVVWMAIPCGCTGRQVRKYSTMKASVLQGRIEKDAAFRLDGDSPIPLKDRPRFQGLAYYPINTSLRFQVRLHRHSDLEAVRLGTNTGETRFGLRYGFVEFHLDGRKCRLQVYQVEDNRDQNGRTRLFVPFRDSTSGNETYGTGRYLDLVEDSSGSCDLDFNRAYNPFCAYGLNFSCPVTPAENMLPVPIRAGERKYLPPTGAVRDL